MPSLNGRNSAEIAEIQQRMAQIRREMHADVQGAVRGAQSLTDWRTIVANHPWAALGAAAGVGYLVVPHRPAPPKPARIQPVSSLPEATQVSAKVRPPSSPVSWRLMGSVFSLLTPVLIRAAQNYALNQLEQWLAAHPVRVRDRESGPEPGDVPAGETQFRSVRFPDRR